MWSNEQVPVIEDTTSVKLLKTFAVFAFYGALMGLFALSPTLQHVYAVGAFDLIK